MHGRANIYMILIKYKILSNKIKYKKKDKKMRSVNKYRNYCASVEWILYCNRREKLFRKSTITQTPIPSNHNQTPSTLLSLSLLSIDRSLYNLLEFIPWILLPSLFHFPPFLYEIWTQFIRFAHVLNFLYSLFFSSVLPYFFFALLAPSLPSSSSSSFGPHGKKEETVHLNSFLFLAVPKFSNEISVFSPGSCFFLFGFHAFFLGKILSFPHWLVYQEAEVAGTSVDPLNFKYLLLFYN